MLFLLSSQPIATLRLINHPNDHLHKRERGEGRRELYRFYKLGIPALSLYKLCDFKSLILESIFFQLNHKPLPRYLVILRKGTLEILGQQFLTKTITSQIMEFLS